MNVCQTCGVGIGHGCYCAKCQAQIDAARVAPEPAQEIAQALKILAPNMPESGLLDACRQVKQVAISEADNSEKLEAQLATLTAERDEARAEIDGASKNAARDGAEIGRLHRELTEAHAEIARLQQERDAYAGKLHKLQARLTPPDPQRTP